MMQKQNKTKVLGPTRDLTAALDPILIICFRGNFLDFIAACHTAEIQLKSSKSEEGLRHDVQQNVGDRRIQLMTHVAVAGQAKQRPPAADTALACMPRTCDGCAVSASAHSTRKKLVHHMLHRVHFSSKFYHLHRSVACHCQHNAEVREGGSL